MRTKEERERGVIVGQRVKLRRLELGMTQKELAEKVGRHLSMVNKVETNETALTLEYAVTFAKVLDCPLEWLAGGNVKRDKMDDPRNALPMMQRRILSELNELSWRDQREVLEYVRYVAYKRKMPKKDGEQYADETTDK